MSNMPGHANEIAAPLHQLLKNPASADLIGRIGGIDWTKAPLDQRRALRDEAMRAPEIRAATEKLKFFGFETSGIGGMASGSAIVGGGGGGGLLWRDGAGDQGVGFAFGSAGVSLGGTAHFLLMGYRAVPSDFWGLMHGAYAKASAGPGVGVFWGHLGSGWDGRYEFLLFAVGVGLDLGAGGYVGGAWKY